jgi:hypothetical protein
MRTLSLAVQLIRKHLFLRVPLIALLITSWFAFTNHCALGMMQPAAQPAKDPAGCCGGKTKPESDLPEGPRECCKIHVIPLTANVVVEFDGSNFQLPPFAIIDWLLTRAPASAPASFLFDHGPPRSISFAESVLQRSLLGNAPPFES